MIPNRTLKKSSKVMRMKMTSECSYVMLDFLFLSFFLCRKRKKKKKKMTFVVVVVENWE